MIKKRVGIIFLMILLISFTGCSGISKRNSAETAGGGILTNKVYVGTQGVNMQFMKDLPPTRLYDSTNINIILELQNKGAYTTNGKMFLTGYDPNIVRGIDAQKNFGPMDGKSKFNADGDIETIDFNSRSIILPDGTDSYKPKFLVSMCYEYETLANPVVCVDPKFYDVSVEEKACQVRDVSMGGGQGGPVGVSLVRVDAVKDRAHFKIDIYNAGKGKVVRYPECPFDLTYDDLNKVKYYITLSGKRPEKCSPENEVRLINGKATVYCSFDIPTENKYAYQTPLQIKLNYGYLDSISKDVEIVKVPT